MELTKKLSIPFCFSLGTLLIVPYYFPSFPLVYFAPYLCSLLTYRYPLQKMLRRAFALGFLCDLLSSHYLLGSYSLASMAVTALLFRYQNLFFSTKPLSFSLQVSAFAFLYTCLDLLFSCFQHPHFILRTNQIFFLLLEISLIHFFYGYLWKSLPLFVEKGRKELQSLLREVKLRKKIGFKKWFRLKKS